ncbi:MAG: dimethylargininase [Actinomycetota bacterium]
MAQVALVRPPAASLADGITTHIEASVIDVELARRQWRDYVDALIAHGWQIVEVPVDDSCPDSVFIEDAAFVFRDVAVVCRPGADERRPEVPPVAQALAAQGYRVVEIHAPGTIDGGDVMKIGDDVYIGRGGRTNDAGIEQVRAALEPLGARVHAVDCDKALHLKSAVTALPDGSVIGWGPVVPDDGLPPVLAMPEEGGAHVVDIGGGAVLMAASGPTSVQQIAARGYEPVVVDISEFEKLEGCVTCLSIRLRDL